MKSRERIKLTKGELLRHFGISILLLIPVIICVYYWLEEVEDLYLFPIAILLGISIFFFWANWDRLFFKKYKAELTDEQFIEAVQVTAKELNWQISILEGSYAEIFRFRGFWEDNVSEKINIKKRESILFINSIGNSGVIGQRNYSKRNKENVDSFLLNVKAILQGKNIEEVIVKRQKMKEEEFWKESEWTIGRILKRIVGYGLVLIFILIGVFVDGNNFDLGFLSILFSIGVGLHYIKNDLAILWKKRLKRNNKIESD